MKSVEELVEIYKEAGKKVTAQRICVWTLVANDHSHPSVESIYGRAKKMIGAISKKTVYDILRELVEMKQLEQVDVGAKIKRFDPNVEIPHSHMLCVSCGKIGDYLDKLHVLNRPKQVDGFKVSDVEIILKGLCKECRENKKTSK